MKDFLLIGWGVVATLGAGIVFLCYVAARSDARCERDLRDQARAETHNVRAQWHEHVRQLIDEYYGPQHTRTASVTETSDDQ
jgi:hypothetical protein